MSEFQNKAVRLTVACSGAASVTNLGECQKRFLMAALELNRALDHEIDHEVDRSSVTCSTLISCKLDIIPSIDGWARSRVLLSGPDGLKGDNAGKSLRGCWKGGGPANMSPLRCGFDGGAWAASSH